MLRLVGVPIGDRTVVCRRISIAGSRTPSASLSIGVDCMINEGCRFDTGGTITIGDDVYFGHDVAVLTTTHEVGAHKRLARHPISEPVCVGDGAGSALGR